MMDITTQAKAIKGYFECHQEEMIAFLEELVLAESPSQRPETFQKRLIL